MIGFPWRSPGHWARFTAALLVVAAVCKTACGGEPEDSAVPVSGAEKISPTWSRTLPVSDPPDAKFGEWRVWVQEGWLLAERRTGDGEIDWQVVLAKVVGDEPPEIIVKRRPPGARVVRHDPRTGDTVLPGPTGPIPGAMRLSYRDGRYFIRDEFGSFRCMREPKIDEQPWPQLEVPPADARSVGGGAGGGAGSAWLSSRVIDSWITIAAGPYPTAQKHLTDCLLRLSHMDLPEGAQTKLRGRPGVACYINGERFVVDDSELLVAERLESWRLPIELKARAKRDPVLAAKLALQKLKGAPPPELSGEAWVNTDKPLSWKVLRGKPVLLVLFDLKQPSFAPLVPPLQTIQETYAKQGLEVVGIHARARHDDIKKNLAEERVTFPGLVDDGQAEERFGIAFSACILVDRQGNVASVYKDSLAPPADIEECLEEKSNQE